MEKGICNGGRDWSHAATGWGHRGLLESPAAGRGEEGVFSRVFRGEHSPTDTWISDFCLQKRDRKSFCCLNRNRTAVCYSSCGKLTQRGGMCKGVDLFLQFPPRRRAIWTSEMWYGELMTLLPSGVWWGWGQTEAQTRAMATPQLRLTVPRSLVFQ